MSMPAPQVACPACFAKPGEPCTTPTNTGRRPVAWIHFSRETSPTALPLDIRSGKRRLDTSRAEESPDHTPNLPG